VAVDQGRQRVMCRAHALASLTGVLRRDPVATLPDDADTWAAFLGIAGAHGLLPAVWVAARDSGRLEVPASLARALERAAPPDRTLPELVIRRAYDANVERVGRLLDAGVELLRRFAGAGVRAVPLKGLHSLLAGTWPDPAARTMADLDVLVPAADATRAYAMLRDGGYAEHPDPIGEHADHHLPMLRRGDVTVELHIELLVSGWSALVPAAAVLRRAMFRPTCGGPLLLADDTDAFVHLVAHAQLQEETYALFGLPLRALHETAQLDPASIEHEDARERFAQAGVAHVLDAHCDAAHRLLGAASPATAPSTRARLHTRLTEAGVVAPAAVAAWTYAVRVPRSFAETRMAAEFGPGEGSAWLWRSRARHVARRVAVRLGGRGTKKSATTRSGDGPGGDGDDRRR
jgi:hypothetical protein